MQQFVEQRYPPGSYPYSTMKQLVLDGCKIKSLSPDDSKFLSSFQSLTSLSCSCAGLTTLIGFPSFPSLIKLELQDNLLTVQSGLDRLSVIAPNVRVLRLGGNRIKSAEALISCLKPLKLLEVLDIDKNPFINSENAHECRAHFFSSLPHLKSIDCVDVSGQECNDDDYDGSEDDDDEEEPNDDDDDEESSGDDEDSKALKAFYEKDYAENDDDDDEDQDDFNPMGVEDENDDDEELDGDEDEENDHGNTNSAVAGNKRPTNQQVDATVKRPKI